MFMYQKLTAAKYAKGFESSSNFSLRFAETNVDYGSIVYNNILLQLSRQVTRFTSNTTDVSRNEEYSELQIGRIEFTFQSVKDFTKVTLLMFCYVKLMYITNVAVIEK